MATAKVHQYHYYQYKLVNTKAGKLYAVKAGDTWMITPYSSLKDLQRYIDYSFKTKHHL